ncbi:hypothetical protein Bhyg_15813 [Pseudolycoriella hygida]|uniref:Uncharacterized protein n=1 Tax=Pseudolycoriella hygida TaxID=35572 RepID=A0A9Q0MLF8_9DIPT|nr:hypothetical protein Bhyg_15813 [Pseudolycoriella hygida]
MGIQLAKTMILLNLFSCCIAILEWSEEKGSARKEVGFLKKRVATNTAFKVTESPEKFVHMLEGIRISDFDFE